MTSRWAAWLKRSRMPRGSSASQMPISGELRDRWMYETCRLCLLAVHLPMYNQCAMYVHNNNNNGMHGVLGCGLQRECVGE